VGDRKPQRTNGRSGGFFTASYDRNSKKLQKQAILGLA